MPQHPASKHLDTIWSDLAPYNNQWVAATENEVVTHFESLEDVLQEIAQRKIPFETVALVFVTFGILQ